MLYLDYSKSYKPEDLENAVNAAMRAESKTLATTSAIGAMTAEDRARAVRAWRIVAEMADYIGLHYVGNDKDFLFSLREKKKLASISARAMSVRRAREDQAAPAGLRKAAIEAAEGHDFKALPVSIQHLIKCDAIAASADFDTSADSVEADILAMTPDRIVSAPRKSGAFRLNVGGI